MTGKKIVKIALFKIKQLVKFLLVSFKCFGYLPKNIYVYYGKFEKVLQAL